VAVLHRGWRSRPGFDTPPIFDLSGPENLAEVRQVAAGLSFPVALLGSAWPATMGGCGAFR